MGLFSDLDWVIIAGVAAFLLLGPNSGSTVRQLGRWYGRAMRLKAELVEELARAADLPLPAGGSPGSLRAAILGLDGPSDGRPGIPVAVRTPPTGAAYPPPSPPSPTRLPWTGGEPVTSWSSTFSSSDDGRRLP